MLSLLALLLAEGPCGANLPLAQMSPIPECKEKSLALWPKPVPGFPWSREHYKLTQKHPRLPHNSPPCRTKEAHSGTAGRFLGDFPYKITVCISHKISCPPNHNQHRQAAVVAEQPREGNRVNRWAVSYCKGLGRHEMGGGGGPAVVLGACCRLGSMVPSQQLSWVELGQAQSWLR